MISITDTLVLSEILIQRPIAQLALFGETLICKLQHKHHMEKAWFYKALC